MTVVCMLPLQWPFLHLFFVVYRLLVATYAVAVTIMSVLIHPSDLLPWPVWLTNWSFFLLTCHLLCAAVVILLNTCCERRHSSVPSASRSTAIPCYMKLSWFLFSVAAPAAIIVTTIFFAAIFPQLHRSYLSVDDIALHVTNTVLVILEFTIAAFPVRLLHVVYTWCYGLAYVIFSAIYWAFDHSHVMYPGVLDWNAPRTTAVVIVIVALVGVPLLQFILFGIYQLRLYIFARCACRYSLD